MSSTLMPPATGSEPSPFRTTIPPAAILLVDDQPARLITYQAILSNLNVECVSVHSGFEALERLLWQEFAAIVMDVSMPVMDGFETARRIREHPRVGGTPIIFVTGIHISDFERLKGYEVGAIDYIAVPIVPEILRSKVAILVELYQRRGELQTLNRALEEARERLTVDHAKAVADSELHRRAVFEHPSELTTVLEAVRDSSGQITDWTYRNANGNALRLLGESLTTLVGKRISEVFDAERAASAGATCAQVLASGAAIRYESEFGEQHFLVTIFPIGKDCVVSSGIDITERKRMQDALKETDRRKDEFLAMLAHELRNPVAPIRNAAEVLARTANEPQFVALAAIVQRQTAQLARLLDDLLDVARISRGRIELRQDVISLQSCVDLAIETIEPLVREKGHRLTVEHAARPLSIRADRARLTQCIANLLGNAAKYTRTGGAIAIRTHVEDNDAVVTVSDNGIGIAPEFLPQVFELFAQSERTLDRSQGGLGIGLSICKRLIEMHDGRVTAQSRGLDQGSEFTLRLPLVEASITATPTASTRATRGRSILIVDDNRDAADTLGMLLQIAGHEVAMAYSGEEALEMIADRPPEVVFLDIGLPLMDGYEVARRIRRSHGEVRLIALSGYGQAGDRQRSSAAGFDAHLIKPVDMEMIEKALE